MDKFSIESKIKNRLKNHREAIDTEELLKSMGFDKKDNDKKRGAIWFIGGGLLLLIGILSYFLMYSGKNDNNYPSKKTFHSNPIQSTKKIDSLPDLPTEKESLKIAQSINLLYNNNISTSISTSTSKNNLSNTNGYYTSQTDISPTATSPIGRINGYDKRIKTNPQISEALDTSNRKNLTRGQKTIVQEKNQRYSTALLEPLVLLVHRNSNIINCNLSYDLNNNSITNYAPSWTILGHIGVSNYKKGFTTNNNIDSVYLQFAKKNEKELEQISFGISSKYQWAPNWYINTGLEWGVYNAKQTYQEYIEDSVQIISYNNIHINYEGDTSQTLGTTNHSTIQRTWSLYNQHHLFSIPISIGYESQLTNIDWFIEGGISTSIYSINKGKHVNHLYRIEIDPPIYKSKFVFQANFAIGLAYKLSPVTKLWINANIGRSLNSITKQSYIYNESYQHLGIKLGVAYKIP